MIAKYPICNSEEIIPIFQKENMPIYLLERHLNLESALNAKTGDIDFVFCLNCLFTFNKAFDATLVDYQVNYESSRSNSEYFNNYLRSVCKDIGNTFSIQNKTVVEVDSGDGDFLVQLRDLFKFSGWGFEPNLIKTKLKHKDLTFIGDYYDHNILKNKPNLVILRHVLEHQSNVHKFLGNILGKQSSRPNNIYIEIPNWEWIIKHEHIHVFSYEHCSYFSKNSLVLALEKNSYTNIRTSLTFENEYLQYFGTSGTPQNNHRFPNQRYKESVIQKTRLFAKKIPVILQKYKSYFEEFNDAVLWGAAGKGTSLLNLLNIDYHQLPYVVDSNPRRHHNYMPATGQKIIAPETLKNIKPQYVLITNSSYQKEIQATLNSMELKATIVTI